MQIAKDILRCKEHEKELTFEKIMDVTSKFYEVDITDILGTARNQKVALARQIAIYLCRELMNQSFENIGEFFNKKHTTAMYAYEQIRAKISVNNSLSADIREIKQALKVL